MNRAIKRTPAETNRSLRRRAFIATAVLALSVGTGRDASAGQGVLAQIKQSHTVTVGVANEQPYSYVTAGGTVKGFVTDTIGAIFKPLGVDRLNPVILDFSGLIPGLLAGRFQVIGAGDYITPARCKTVGFSNPIYASGMGFIVKAGNPVDLHSLADVKASSGSRVASEIGSSEVGDFKTAGIPQSQVRLYSTDQEALSALEAGRVEAVYLPSIEVAQLVVTAKRPDIELATPFRQLTGPDGKPEFSYGGLAFRKADRELIDYVNTRLEQLRTSGELARILESYGLTTDSVPPTSLTASSLCAG
jgi:polar amino acid transport system substrate-binding protein